MPQRFQHRTASDGQLGGIEGKKPAPREYREPKGTTGRCRRRFEGLGATGVTNVALLTVPKKYLANLLKLASNLSHGN